MAGGERLAYPLFQVGVLYANFRESCQASELIRYETSQVGKPLKSKTWRRAKMCGVLLDREHVR